MLINIFSFGVLFGIGHALRSFTHLHKHSFYLKKAEFQVVIIVCPYCITCMRLSSSTQLRCGLSSDSVCQSQARYVIVIHDFSLSPCTTAIMTPRNIQKFQSTHSNCSRVSFRMELGKEMNNVEGDGLVCMTRTGVGGPGNLPDGHSPTARSEAVVKCRDRGASWDHV
jgi:hypothetical protein